MKLDIDEPACQNLLLPLVGDLNSLPFVVHGQLVVRHGKPPFLLPEKSVRTFFHEQWPSHYRLNDIDFIVCQSYRIALDRKNLHVEFLYDSLERDAVWRMHQLIRWLVKSSALSAGWTYLPMFSFVREGSVPVLLAGDEGLGKMVALQILCETGYDFTPGGTLIGPDGERVIQLPIGTAASFLEWEFAQNEFGKHCSNPGFRSTAASHPLESCAVFFVDTWNEPVDSVEGLSAQELCRRLTKLNRREYEYFSADQIKELALRYQEHQGLVAQSRTIIAGLEPNHSAMRQYLAL